MIPLWISNHTDTTREINLNVNLPSGWTLESGNGKISVSARQIGAMRVEIKLPLLPENQSAKPEPQEVTVHADSDGKAIGDVKLRVELRKRALPE